MRHFSFAPGTTMVDGFLRCCPEDGMARGGVRAMSKAGVMDGGAGAVGLPPCLRWDADFVG